MGVVPCKGLRPNFSWQSAAGILRIRKTRYRGGLVNPCPECASPSSPASTRHAVARTGTAGAVRRAARATAVAAKLGISRNSYGGGDSGLQWPVAWGAVVAAPCCWWAPGGGPVASAYRRGVWGVGRQCRFPQKGGPPWERTAASLTPSEPAGPTSKRPFRARASEWCLSKRIGCGAGLLG